jgi:hypothetical protein
MTKYKQGLFTPVNSKKYVGDINRIVYRSSYEFRFMTICDLSNKILRWSSEPFPIPYYDVLTEKVRRYYVDFWLEYIKNGEVCKALIEIKPECQTKKPKLTGKMTPKKEKNYIYEAQTFIKNSEKWKAAQEFCDKNKIDFFIITEKNLDVFK